jgi:hypothetical protein
MTLDSSEWQWRGQNIPQLLQTDTHKRLILFVLEENARGKRAWERHVRELESSGEKLDLGELIPPPIPDGSNFAVMPLFKPLYEFTQGNGRDCLAGYERRRAA